MRVRLEQAVRLYWNYAVQTYDKDSEHEGDLARHLLDNAPQGAVNVIEADPEPEKPQQTNPAAPTEDAEGVDGDRPPVDGTIDALILWVGDDKQRAAQALAAEQEKDKPRSTVVKRLAALVDADNE